MDSTSTFKIDHPRVWNNTKDEYTCTLL